MKFGIDDLKKLDFDKLHIPRFDWPELKIKKPKSSPELKFLSKFNLRCLSMSVLRYIAIVAMSLDHIFAVFFSGYPELRIVGRIVIPILALALVEGYAHTRNRFKYLASMILCAAVSEIPWQLLMYGEITFTELGPLFALSFAFLGLLVFDALSKQRLENRVICAAGIAVIGALLCGTYGIYIIFLVLIFALLKNYSTVHKGFCNSLWSLFYGIGANSLQIYAVIASIPILLYNGKRGNCWKWFFYIYYPAHILVLYGIAKLMGIR